MNLFSSLKQFSDNARQWLSLPQTPASEQQPPSTLQRFGILNFSGDATAMSHETVRSLSENVPADDPNSTTGAPLAAATQTRDKQWVWGEGLNKKGSYVVTIKPQDLGLQKWQRVDPKAVARAAYEKAVVKMGITNDPERAKEIVGKLKFNDVTTWTTNGDRVVTASDYGDKDWMNERLDSRNNYAMQMSSEDVANILAASKEVLGEDFKPPANLSKSQLAMMGITITGGGIAASIALKGAPVLGGGFVAPALIAAGAGLPFAIVSSQYLKEVMDNGLLRERTNILPSPHQMTMDDAEPPPFARPADTADRPAQPNAQPIPDANTQPGQELTVRPQNQPQAQPQAEAQPQAKPETTIDSLPQPYTPDVPTNAPQQQPPRQIDPRLIPPTIVGGTAIGKVILDKVNGDNQTNLAPPPEFTKASDPAFDVSHLDLQQVAAGSTDLSRAVINYRLENQVSIYKNVAAFEYKDSKGDPQLKIFESSEGGQHSERRIADWMRENNIKPEQVTRVYSELEPCSTRNSFCKQYLAKNTPQAKVSYSFEYGDNKPSKQRGVKELKRYAQDLLKGTKYAQSEQLNKQN